MPEFDPKSMFVDLLDSPAPPLPARADLLRAGRSRLRRRRAIVAVCTAGLTTLTVIAGIALLPVLGGDTDMVAGSPGSTGSPRSPGVSLSPSIRSRPQGSQVPAAQRHRLDALLAALESAMPTGISAPADRDSSQDLRYTTVDGWQAAGWHYSVGTTASDHGVTAALTLDSFSGFGALAAGCEGTTNMAGDTSTDTCREYTAADGSRIGVITRGDELHAAWGDGDVAVGISQRALNGSPIGKPLSAQQLADLVVDPSLRP